MYLMHLLLSCSHICLCALAWHIGHALVRRVKVTPFCRQLSIISLNACVSVVVAIIHLVWVVQSPARFMLSVYLAAANLFITLLLLEALLPKPLHAIPKYAVNKITGSGMGIVTVSEQNIRNRAIHDAYQLAKKNPDDVFVVVDVRGNRIATVNHSDVSIQMHN